MDTLFLQQKRTAKFYFCFILVFINTADLTIGKSHHFC